MVSLRAARRARARVRDALATALIPYISIPPLPIVGPTVWNVFGHAVPVDVSIKPFGTLVAIGVWIGTDVIQRHGKRMGLDPEKLSSFVFTLLMWGFIGGHVLDEVFYHPAAIAADPLSLVRIWESQSSFGGFAGAFFGLFMWAYYSDVFTV